RRGKSPLSPIGTGAMLFCRDNTYEARLVPQEEERIPIGGLWLKKKHGRVLEGVPPSPQPRGGIIKPRGAEGGGANPARHGNKPRQNVAQGRARALPFSFPYFTLQWGSEAA